MNHKEIIHFFLKQFLNPETSRALDMTAGNGHDSLFLAQHAKEVYAVDIQKEALEATKKRCRDFDNVHYILSDHSAVNFEEKDRFDVAMYNLGYLPGSDKTIVTQASSTIHSLKKIYPLTKKAISISAYRGHDGGEEEYQAIVDFLNQADIPYHLLSYDQPKAPVSFLIDRVNKQASDIRVDELRRLPQKQAYLKLQAIFQGFEK